MDIKGGIQLLPGTKKRLGIKVPGENRFLYIGSVIFGAALISMISFNQYKSSLKSQMGQLNDQIVALEQKRNKNDEIDIRLTKDRLVFTSNLIKDHTYWTQAFSWLESTLQKEVQIKDFSRTPDGKIVFSALAVNYTVVARQIAAFLADNKVLDLKLGKINSTSEGTIEFDMQLTVDLDKLIKK